MLINLLSITLGFGLLAWGADRLVAGAVSIANNFGISPLLIGLTVVAFGTSTPEIVVSITAALRGNPGIAIGNAIGSNIANIGLVLGVTALITPLKIRSQTLRREYPLLFIIMLITLILMLDGTLSQSDGILLLIGLMLLLILFAWMAHRSKTDEPLAKEYRAELSHPLSTQKALFCLITGLVLLPSSSYIIVKGAVSIAQTLGISDLMIGLTIIALGTSLPEVAASITSAIKGEHDIAIGNILGSNMFNLLAVLAFPSIIQSIPISTPVLTRDIPVMFAITIVLFLVAYGFRGPGHITRWEGGILLLSYFAYIGLLVINAMTL